MNSKLLPLLFLLVGFTYPEKPQNYVNDYAQVLQPQVRVRLESDFERFEKRTGSQAVVAIFPTLNDEAVDDVAAKLFEKWKLGEKEKNNGILLLLSIEDRQIRIEVGYGLEGLLPDVLASKIIRNELVPFLKQKQYPTALLIFLDQVEKAIKDPNLAKAARKAPPTNWPVVIFWVVFFFSMLLILHSNRTRYRGRGLTSRGRGWENPGGWFWFGGGGGSGWGGGSGGGGFSGGGGGSSGGGGASGRW